MNGIDNNNRIRPTEQQERYGGVFLQRGWALLLFLLAVLFAAEQWRTTQTGFVEEEPLFSVRAEPGGEDISWVISLDGTAVGEVRGIEFILSPAGSAGAGEQNRWIAPLPSQLLRQAAEDSSLRLRVTLSRIFLADGSVCSPEQKPQGILDRLCSWVRRVFGE